MKDTAEILKFRGKELRTPADVTAVLEALMCDILSGAVTPGEAKKIQKEVNDKIKFFGATIKTLQQWRKLEKDSEGR